MDEHAEVKKKRAWWVKASIWLVGIAVFLVAAVLGAGTLYDAHARHVARELAALPVPERNVAIFDAARKTLESHYYDPAVFQTEAWRAYVSHWRERAATESATLLYANVLANFGASFLDSHVEFEAPPAPLSDSTPSGPSAAMKPLPRDEEAAWKSRFDILLSGPGFEVATIRRGRLTAAIVDDVRPGSAADRAGITPGWALPFLSTTVDKDGIRFTGTFLELTGDAAQTLERTGHPPGAATAGPQDPYTLEHGAKHQYEPDLSPTRTDFETRRLAGNVTYLRFDHFFAGDIMSRAFDAIDSAGPEGMIIDLRHNRGGVMTQLQRFLGRLLGNDVDIGRLRVGESTSRMRTWRWGSIYQGPVIMLIGPQSMSAAEIAAAAVQDHKRGLVIGRMSSGAVLNGRKYPLPDGGTIMVPVQDYYRAANRRIEGVGVEPDVRVLATLEDVRAHRDPALDRALQLLPSLRAEMPAPREPAELSR